MFAKSVLAKLAVAPAAALVAGLLSASTPVMAQYRDDVRPAPRGMYEPGHDGRDFHRDHRRFAPRCFMQRVFVRDRFGGHYERQRVCR